MQWYWLSQYIGIELGINEFIGLNKNVKYSYTSTSGSSSSEAQISGMMLQIVPAIVITPGLEKVNPYARLGMIAGILPSITQIYNRTYNSGDEFIPDGSPDKQAKMSFDFSNVELNIGIKLKL